MSASAHKDPVFIQSSAAILEEMQSQCSSLEFATVVTDDGFEVASIGGDETQHRRVASMSSSIQALGDAVSREVNMGDTDYLIIAGEKGNLIQLRIDEHELILAGYFRSTETVGKALSIARLAAENVANLPIAQAA